MNEKNIVQDMLNANIDPTASDTQQGKTAKKNRMPIMVLVAIAAVALVILLVIILKGKMSDADKTVETYTDKKVETYRGVCWGMTKEEIEELETNRGNTAIDAGLDGNTAAYTIHDLIPSGETTDRCVYTFDGEGETLSSFAIASLTDGENLFVSICRDLVEMYGEGEYDAATDSGVYYLTADWTNEHETIEGIAFSSSTNDEAYFTFTYRDVTKNSGN